MNPEDPDVDPRAFFPGGMEKALHCSAEVHAQAFLKWAAAMPAPYFQLAGEIDLLQSAQGIHSKDPHPWHRFADRSAQRLRRSGIIALDEKRRWVLTDLGRRIEARLKLDMAGVDEKPVFDGAEP